MEKKETPQKLICDLCGKEASNKSNLKRHKVESVQKVEIPSTADAL